jgi:hypothetical protein
MGTHERTRLPAADAKNLLEIQPVTSGGASFLFQL